MEYLTLDEQEIISDAEDDFLNDIDDFAESILEDI